MCVCVFFKSNHRHMNAKGRYFAFRPFFGFRAARRRRAAAPARRAPLALRLLEGAFAPSPLPNVPRDFITLDTAERKRPKEILRVYAPYGLFVSFVQRHT